MLEKELDLHDETFIQLSTKIKVKKNMTRFTTCYRIGGLWVGEGIQNSYYVLFGTY